MSDIIKQYFGDFHDAGTQQLIAPVQLDLIAQRAYTKDRDYFVFNNGLYKVTDDIALGDTIVIGSTSGCNADVADSVMEECIPRMKTGTPFVVGSIEVNGTVYPVYRKIVDFGALPSNNTKEVSSGIVGTVHILSLSAICHSSTINISIAIPFVNDASNIITMNFIHTSNNIKIASNFTNSYNSCLVTIDYY